jgi:hypothetical protein
MAKQKLKDPMDKLEADIIETLLAGHREWRPDLAYPESYSDMQAAVRGLLRMFDVRRRPLAIDLEYESLEAWSRTEDGKKEILAAVKTAQEVVEELSEAERIAPEVLKKHFTI